MYIHIYIYVSVWGSKSIVALHEIPEISPVKRFSLDLLRPLGSEVRPEPTIKQGRCKGDVREPCHKIWPHMLQYLHLRIFKVPLVP